MLVRYTPCSFFFFFQAEDGIRDVAVTGVQTCALPISPPGPTALILPVSASATVSQEKASNGVGPPGPLSLAWRNPVASRKSPLASMKLADWISKSAMFSTRGRTTLRRLPSLRRSISATLSRLTTASVELSGEKAPAGEYLSARWPSRRTSLTHSSREGDDSTLSICPRSKGTAETQRLASRQRQAPWTGICRTALGFRAGLVGRFLDNFASG